MILIGFANSLSIWQVFFKYGWNIVNVTIVSMIFNCGLRRWWLITIEYDSWLVEIVYYLGIIAILTDFGLGLFTDRLSTFDWLWSELFCSPRLLRLLILESLLIILFLVEMFTLDPRRLFELISEFFNISAISANESCIELLRLDGLDYIF